MLSDLKTWMDLSNELYYPNSMRHGTVFKVNDIQLLNLSLAEFLKNNEDVEL